MMGKVIGRQSNNDILLFDSVGFATEDFTALRYIRDHIDRTGHYLPLDMLADPDDLRNLFGMVKWAK